MRLYHFLSAKWALDDIQRRRLKLSEIENLNDPFELWCMTHEDRETRAELRGWKKEAAKSYTLLCFCKRWSNSLLWSHYADRHRGICLGFNVRDDAAKKVAYTEHRIPLRLPFDKKTTNTLLFTKYKGWSYEQEWRVWSRLEERDADGNCYRDFDKDISLREIIAGPLCTVRRDAIERALGDLPGVQLIKSRLALKSFNVTKDERGFQ